MKKIFSLVCFLFSLVSKNTFAQDTITLVNREIIFAEIVSVDSQFVNYRVYNSKDRTIENVFLSMTVSIKYKDGFELKFDNKYIASEEARSADSICKLARSDAKIELKKYGKKMYNAKFVESFKQKELLDNKLYMICYNDFLSNKRYKKRIFFSPFYYIVVPVATLIGLSILLN